MGASGETGFFVGGIYENSLGFKRTILAFARDSVIYKDGYGTHQCKRETFKKNYSNFAAESSKLFPYTGTQRERVVNEYRERIDVHLFRDGVVRVRHPRVNPDGLESFIDLRHLGERSAFCVVLGEPPSFPEVRRWHWFRPNEPGAMVIELQDADANLIGKAVAKLQAQGKRPDASGLYK
jgi:hypothetical protein